MFRAELGERLGVLRLETRALVCQCLGMLLAGRLGPGRCVGILGTQRVESRRVARLEPLELGGSGRLVLVVLSTQRAELMGILLDLRGRSGLCLFEFGAHVVECLAVARIDLPGVFSRRGLMLLVERRAQRLECGGVLATELLGAHRQCVLVFGARLFERRLRLSELLCGTRALLLLRLELRTHCAVGFVHLRLEARDLGVAPVEVSLERVERGLVLCVALTQLGRQNCRLLLLELSAERVECSAVLLAELLRCGICIVLALCKPATDLCRARFEALELLLRCVERSLEVRGRSGVRFALFLTLVQLRAHSHKRRHVLVVLLGLGGCVGDELVVLCANRVDRLLVLGRHTSFCRSRFFELRLQLANRALVTVFKVGDLGAGALCVLLERALVRYSCIRNSRAMFLVELARECRECGSFGGWSVRGLFAEPLHLDVTRPECVCQRSHLGRLFGHLLVARGECGTVRLFEVFAQRRKRRRLAVVELALERRNSRRPGALEDLGALVHLCIVFVLELLAQLVERRGLVSLMLLVACRHLRSVLLLERSLRLVSRRDERLALLLVLLVEARHVCSVRGTHLLAQRTQLLCMLGLVRT